MNTYTLKVDSCEACPKIVAEFPNISENVIQRAIQGAKEGFRSVEVVCEQTGEIMFTYYASTDFHEPLFRYGDAIDYLTHICYN